VREALEVTNKAVMEALDGLPPVKVHWNRSDPCTFLKLTLKSASVHGVGKIPVQLDVDVMMTDELLLKRKGFGKIIHNRIIFVKRICL